MQILNAHFHFAYRNRLTYNHMFSNRLFSYFSYETKYHMLHIKQNSPALATTCKRSHVDKMYGAPVGPFCVRIDLSKNPVLYGYLFQIPWGYNIMCYCARSAFA